MNVKKITIPETFMKYDLSLHVFGGKISLVFVSKRVKIMIATYEALILELVVKYLKLKGGLFFVHKK